MLMFQRRVGDMITVDDCIEITISALHHQRVQLRIICPRQLSVQREWEYDDREVCNGAVPERSAAQDHDVLIYTVALAVDQRLHLGDDITLMATESNTKKARIGVAAAKHIKIDRTELWLAKQSGPREASLAL